MPLTQAVTDPQKNLPATEVSERLAFYLLEENLLERPAVDRALRAARSMGERLDIVLAKLGLVSDADLGTALSKFLCIPIVEPGEIPATAILTERIDADFVRFNRLMPLRDDDRELVIGLTDPFNEEPLAGIRYLMEKPVSKRLFRPADFDKAYLSLYQDSTEINVTGISGSLDANEIDIQRLRDLASEAPTIRLVDDIIRDAVEIGASDIHLEPNVDSLLIRYRVDGHLRPARTLAAGQRASVTSRVKIMASLDIAERRLPQDGRIKLAVRGTDIDFRVSTTPTAFGESVVMRILDRSRIELDFVKLGFPEALMQSLERLLHEPNGIILVTGPTGSGKTTTLYTVLKALNRSHRKLFTVEDPIEYQLTGINQIQVHPDIGLTFPHALRSILRQDPDVIMIGEIRDLETARIAIQASLTGHLVFSTLHTNSASSTMTRLVDMGLENYLLASTIKAVLAQRLVRRLCAHCSTPHPEAKFWETQMQGKLDGSQSLTPPDIRQPKGCNACTNTGFSGRTTVAELLILTPAIQSLLLADRPDAEIEDAARQAGMISMYEDGLAKVWRGETAIEEILRATRTV